MRFLAHRAYNCNPAVVTRSSDLFTAAEVADLVGRDISTVNRDAAAGRLVAVKKGRGLRGSRMFERAAVDAYVAARAEPAA